MSVCENEDVQYWHSIGAPTRDSMYYMYWFIVARAYETSACIHRTSQMHMQERSRQARNHPIPTDETQRKFDTMVCDLSQKSKNASYHCGNSLDSCILSFLAYLQGCYNLPDWCWLHRQAHEFIIMKATKGDKPLPGREWAYTVKHGGKIKEDWELRDQMTGIDPRSLGSVRGDPMYQAKFRARIRTDKFLTTYVCRVEKGQSFGN